MAISREQMTKLVEQTVTKLKSSTVDELCDVVECTGIDCSTCAFFEPKKQSIEDTELRKAVTKVLFEQLAEAIGYE